jgi:hypothetical protein
MNLRKSGYYYWELFRMALDGVEFWTPVNKVVNPRVYAEDVISQGKDPLMVGIKIFGASSFFYCFIHVFLA